MDEIFHAEAFCNELLNIDQMQWMSGINDYNLLMGNMSCIFLWILRHSQAQWIGSQNEYEDKEIIWDNGIQRKQVLLAKGSTMSPLSTQCRFLTGPTGLSTAFDGS